VREAGLLEGPTKLLLEQECEPEKFSVPKFKFLPLIELIFPNPMGGSSRKCELDTIEERKPSADPTIHNRVYDGPRS
jgi:hypothetical protein